MEKRLIRQAEFIVDTMSAYDSNLITDYLEKEDIEYTVRGSKITIKLDKKSPRASHVLDHLNDIAANFETEQDGFVIDTMSAYDSNLITDYLDKRGIRYTIYGSKITIKLDRASLDASAILSYLYDIANFEEI